MDIVRAECCGDAQHRAMVCPISETRYLPIKRKPYRTNILKIRTRYTLLAALLRRHYTQPGGEAR